MKELYVKNDKKFYKKLFWYKSWLFRGIKFVSDDSEDLEFNSIVNALNIKKRKERIKYIYDYSCKKIDDYNQGKNICGFNENGQCYAQQVPGGDHINGCCRLCAYQNSNGCPTSNLSCKLFYCDYVTEKNEVIKYRDLKILKLLTLRQRLIVRDDYFTTRESVLKDLYIGSVVVYATRMAVRMFINLVELKKNKFI